MTSCHSVFVPRQPLRNLELMARIKTQLALKKSIKVGILTRTIDSHGPGGGQLPQEALTLHWSNRRSPHLHLHGCAGPPYPIMSRSRTSP